MNETKLLKYAVDYLSKYDSSKKNLLDVLKRKIFKSNISGIEKKNLIDVCHKIILKLEKNKLIDDNKYIVSKISSLSRIGKSKNFIFNYLLKKGLDKSKIDSNLDIFNDNNKDWELDAARLFAKKKRLLDSSEIYEKKLAKMARAGFSYDLCKKILN